MLIKGSPNARVKRARTKAPKGRPIPAQGTASLRATPWVTVQKINSSFFPSGSARTKRAEPEGKKEVGWVDRLPSTAASRPRFRRSRVFAQSAGLVPESCVPLLTLSFKMRFFQSCCWGRMESIELSIVEAAFTLPRFQAITPDRRRTPWTFSTFFSR